MIRIIGSTGNTMPPPHSTFSKTNPAWHQGRNNVSHTPTFLKSILGEFRKQLKEILTRIREGITKHVMELITKKMQDLSQDNNRKLHELNKMITQTISLLKN